MELQVSLCRSVAIQDASNVARRNSNLIMASQDFTEVDNNVTRHIPDELQRDDWSALIMHYLGLDHIGHKSGPRRCGFICLLLNPPSIGTPDPAVVHI